MSKIAALIPARGGSKGIPRKNIAPLHGKPLLAYTIEHAINTPAITRTVVSTDSPEIADVAKQYGADIVWRPQEISGDKASSELALLHVLDQLRATEQYEPDLVVFLQATSPIRQPDDIQKAIDTLIQEEADSLLSVAPFHGFLWRKGTHGICSFSYDYTHRQMRQDAPEDFVENGSIYIFKPQILREFHNRLGGKIAFYRMRATDSLQIDEPDDIILIEALMAQGSKQTLNLTKIRALVLDFDGVLTDNRVLISQEGTEAVMAHRGDGWGIARLKEAGYFVFVISTEENPVVAARCQKLGIEFLQGASDKLTALKSLLNERHLSPEEVAYIGNDVNDLDCMNWVGLPIAVQDAVKDVRACAAWITEAPGGRGAVREIADLLLQQLKEAT